MTASPVLGLVQGEALRDPARFLPAQDPVEVGGRQQGRVRVVLAARRARKPAVVIRQERRRVRVRGGDITDLAPPQLLHQAVLERQVRALDAPLRRRRIGADDVDVQAAEGATELGDAGPALGFLPIVAEDGSV